MSKKKTNEVVEHSQYFEKVKNYYNDSNGLWSKERVHNAVDIWITSDEYYEIVGETYQNN